MNNNDEYQSIFPTNEQQPVEESTPSETIPVQKETIPVSESTPVVETPISIPTQVVVSPVAEEPIQEVTTPRVSLPEERVENNIDPISTEFVDEHGDKNDVTIESANAYNPNMRKEANYKLVESMKPTRNPLLRSRRLVHRGVFNSEIGIKNSGFTGVASLACITALAGLVVAYLILRF